MAEPLLVGGDPTLCRNELQEAQRERCRAEASLHGQASEGMGSAGRAGGQL